MRNSETLFRLKVSSSGKLVLIDKLRFLKTLDIILETRDLKELKSKVKKLKDTIIYLENKPQTENFSTNEADDVVKVKYDYLVSELTQIEKTLTLKRAHYYLNRLKKALTEVKTTKINDINLNRWKEYDEIITDSLWLFDKRDNSGAHLAWYWGNFIPQIPRQLMLRYTKKGDWILDPFAGSGTTLIECRRLGRNGIGVEINPEVAKLAKKTVENEPNKFNVVTDIITGDSTLTNFRKILEERNIKKVQFIILHPPYHNIIKFSNTPRDLSNAKTISDFLEMLGNVLDNLIPILEDNRYLAIVIGDKYYKGEWIPLGFYVMNEVIKRKNFILKSIVIKNFEETRAKRNQKELWRYRALVGGFYVFKHEYIFIFCKGGSKK